MRNLTLISLVSLLCFSTLSWAQENPSYRFDEVLKYVDMAYVDSIQKDKLVDEAIISMLEELDPHSSYISKEDVAEANQTIDGSFVGVGIRFQILKDTLHVVQTISGGPSEKVGLLAGDKIIHIEEELVAGIGLKNHMVRDRLLGEKGTKVNVKIKRGKSNNLLDFVITRDKIPIHSVDAAYMIDQKTGYIKLNSFSRTTIREMEDGIQQLQEQGMENLILDLQSNGGGLLRAAQHLADEFLSGKKLVVYSEGRARPRYDYKTGKKDLFEKGKLVILTNEYSASASEIVSGAIQDWDRGLIVGRRTYGKGLVQQPIELSDGAQLRLTVARYYTPSGRFIQKPYDDVKDYRKDLLNRYENGEFYHKDSIKLPDSLKFKTLHNKRTVYGGGGIMPDVFVPVDTSDMTDYYRELSRSGAINTFSLTYMEEHRKKLKKMYSDFEMFQKANPVDEDFMKDFFKYVEKEYPNIEKNEEELTISADYLQLILKARLAQNLFDYQEFYQIINTKNEVLQRAIEIISSEEYDNFNLN